MLNFQFKSLKNISETKSLIIRFENHFGFKFPPYYKTFVSNFDVGYEENYVMDSYVDKYLRLSPSSTYNYFTNNGLEIGNILFSDISKHIEKCISKNIIQEDFENELKFIENGYYVIGKYLNYHFILLGIQEDNFDKIFIYDSDTKEKPILAAYDIFELLSLAQKVVEINDSYVKNLGKKYYTPISKKWMINQEVIDEIVYLSEANRSYFPLLEKLIENHISKFTVEISEEAYEELQTLHNNLKDDPKRNYLGLYFDENKLKAYLYQINNELSLNPFENPVVHENIYVLIKQNYLRALFFYTIKDDHVKILTVKDRMKIINLT